MASNTKPIILVLALGEKWMQDMCDDPTSFGAGLNLLSEFADLKRARTLRGALRHLDSNAASPPHGILVTDPGIAKRDNQELLDRVAAYARGGGTVIMSYCFSSNIRQDDMMSFWQLGWNLPWEPASYHRTVLRLNDRASTLRGQVTQLDGEYSQKALHLAGVNRDHCWYLPTEESRTQSLVFPPEEVDQRQTAVALAPVGSGLVGYTGDVNMEDGTQMVVVRMFGL
jgi:hypothetical protein